MNITIKNASIKSTIFLKYGYDHFVNSTKFTHNSSGDAPIHNDLRDAFAALTPFLKWDDDYAFSSELIAAVDLLKSEVYEYIEGKRAPAQNQTMDMFETDIDDEEEGSGKKHFADVEM